MLLKLRPRQTLQEQTLILVPRVLSWFRPGDSKLQEKLEKNVGQGCRPRLALNSMTDRCYYQTNISSIQTGSGHLWPGRAVLLVGAAGGRGWSGGRRSGRSLTAGLLLLRPLHLLLQLVQELPAGEDQPLQLPDTHTQKQRLHQPGIWRFSPGREQCELLSPVRVEGAAVAPLVPGQQVAPLQGGQALSQLRQTLREEEQSFIHLW